MNHRITKTVTFETGIFGNRLFGNQQDKNKTARNTNARRTMKNKKLDKDRIVLAARKLIEAKKNMIAYSNNEISKKDLNDRGVKLTKPL